MATFSWYDYLFFSIMLCFSALIGIYFGCFGTKQSSANEYLMGNKKMKVFPIAVSLVASHVSGITLLAVPADIYRYGAGHWLLVVALAIVAPCTIFVYLPVFFKLQLTSTYEYLERRFDTNNRMFASFLFALSLVLFLPIVIYIPALALSAATGMNIHYITLLVCGVCIFYTTLGGLKAVVWTDALQFIITSGAIFTVAVIGVRAGGGFTEIWTKASEGQRLEIFNFDPDPTLRDSFWIVTFGFGSFLLSLVGVHQSSVQKYLSVATLQEARWSVVYYAIGVALISSFTIFIGLVMYAKYADCDPFTFGSVQKNDQLLPYYVLEVASVIPGLSGLFMAGIFCAALSTLSAHLNCLAGTIYEDFLVKIIGNNNDEVKTAQILKTIVVVSGLICTVLVYVVEQLGGLLPLCLSLNGITYGPMLGMFTLGVLFPKATSKGSFYGAIIGLLFSSSIVVMVQYYKANGMLVADPKPTSVDGCIVNATITSLETTLDYSTTFSTLLSKNSTTKAQLFFLFRLSYYYVCTLATVVTIVFGLLISYLLKSDDPPVDRIFLSPVIYFLLPDENIEENEAIDYSTLDTALKLVTMNSG